MYLMDKWLSEMADTDFVELIGKKYRIYSKEKYQRLRKSL